jgi:acylphosphatase
MGKDIHNQNKAKAHVLISGQVQGVFFRDATRKKAEDLRITGWVRNLPDGRVEVLFEGEKEAIDKIIEWTKKGPDSARVEDIKVKWEEYKDEFSSFAIKY